MSKKELEESILIELNASVGYDLGKSKDRKEIAFNIAARLAAQLKH